MRIAIDGPAASGKGTLARSVAARLGLPYLDTGLLYRAVAYRLVMAGSVTSDDVGATREARLLDPSSLPPEADLRRADLGEGASVVSAHPGVRAALLQAQRAFAATPGGAVLDGRDIGSVVCPDADLKVFVTAAFGVRAARRHADLLPSEPTIAYATVLGDILRRDARDSGRGDAPLTCCPDALVVNTTFMAPAECLDLVISRIDGMVREPRARAA